MRAEEKSRGSRMVIGLDRRSKGRYRHPPFGPPPSAESPSSLFWAGPPPRWDVSKTRRRRRAKRGRVPMDSKGPLGKSNGSEEWMIDVDDMQHRQVRILCHPEDTPRQILEKFLTALGLKEDSLSTGWVMLAVKRSCPFKYFSLKLRQDIPMGRLNFNRSEFDSLVIVDRSPQRESYLGGKSGPGTDACLEPRAQKAGQRQQGEDALRPASLPLRLVGGGGNSSSEEEDFLLATVPLPDTSRKVSRRTADSDSEDDAAILETVREVLSHTHKTGSCSLSRGDHGRARLPPTSGSAPQSIQAYTPGGRTTSATSNSDAAASSTNIHRSTQAPPHRGYRGRHGLG